ncbi:MAG: biopolymer transporter TolR [Anaerophaga sp.]|nr:biopolymer transporter TolR [Anaerophaga sp.]MDN5290804.1 TolB protein [Anaerophaga sp.]
MKKLHTTKLLALIFAAFLINSFIMDAQVPDTGIFALHDDIGETGIPGNALYSPEKQNYSITGSGENVWFGEDAFHFAWRGASGNFILRARIKFEGEGQHSHRKAGWMLRENKTAGSPHFSAVVHGDGLTSLQYREEQDGETREMQSEVKSPDIIQLERRGNTLLMSVARYGEPFSTIKIEAAGLKNAVMAGLFVCSHDSSTTETVTFSNVRFVKPAPADLVPYQEYLGSHLEVLEMSTGQRKIVYTSPISIQAPNWTPDNKYLIYNSEGRLFRIPPHGGIPQPVNTGFATSNNNDHVLTFDGKMIGISHHSLEDNGNSVIYRLPVEGGTPQRITARSPSYLHGWSPDNKYVIYTGERNGQYDIYKIPAEGGREIQLTNQKTLDDGSEYSPDGKYIYFNSARTGTMQLWRMHPDGSEQEQLTFDRYNDWFPHVSPDGKEIVFISYGPEVDAGDHPFYKHVYLRRMPVDGGDPEIVAYLYGGQGTINVPSWSPDGKYISFVSNSGVWW